MAVDGTGIGQNSCLGIIPSSQTWGTAEALVAKTGVPFDSVSPLTVVQDMIQDNSLYKNAFPKLVDQGRINTDFTLSGALRYIGNHWVPITQLIGADAGVLATGTYTHTITMADIVSTFFTSAVQLDMTTDQYYEFPSVTPISFEITTGGDGFMMFNINGITDNVLIDGDATNGSTEFGNLTFRITQATGGKRIPFDNGRVNINAAGGADFNASGEGTDRIFPNAISIKFSRPYERDFQANRTTANSREWQTAQPRHSGIQSDILVTFEFNELEKSDYAEWFQDQTIQKGEILFYQDADNQVKFQFPRLIPLQPTQDIGAPGRIPHTIVFQAVQADAAPTGMTGITQPFALTIVNQVDDYTFDDWTEIT